MKKMGTVGLKWLKISHLVLVVLMLGGIISSLALRLTLKLTTFDEVYLTYKMLYNISDYVIRYGAVGLFITGIVYGVWTNWGWFKHRWITVKWIVFVLQTIFGVFFIDRWMTANVSMLEAERSMALSNPAFVHNHLLIQGGAIAQSVAIIFLIGVSVFKPWRQRNQG